MSYLFRFSGIDIPEEVNKNVRTFIYVGQRFIEIEKKYTKQKMSTVNDVIHLVVYKNICSVLMKG